jgi:hypothetical protein
MTTLTLHGPPELSAFAEECAAGLFTKVHYHFKYPPGSTLENWPVDQIKSLNKDFLATLRNRANVYTIFIGEAGETPNWRKMYVGERKSIGLRERITQHLISKNHQTGSALSKVKEAVASGKEIGVSLVKVDPDALRLYVEETIIRRHKAELPWNTHG